MLKKIKEATEYIKKTTNFSPEYGIILGTGLGSLVSEISIEHSISYTNIPNFPTSTVEGHPRETYSRYTWKEKSNCNAREDFIIMKAMI